MISTNESTQKIDTIIADLLKAIPPAPVEKPKPLAGVLESVSDLRKQKVSDDQIARAIYGHRVGDLHEGPFVQANSLPDSSLIDQQCAYEAEIAKNGRSDIEPIVPLNWIPPWMTTPVEESVGIREYARKKLEAVLAGLAQ